MLRRGHLRFLKAISLSSKYIGLVFGGFGSKNVFPSLYAISIDGIYFGKIKWRNTYNLDIGRQGGRAAIIPFAQSEMAERFLFGIDSDAEGTLLRFVTRSSASAIELIEKAIENKIGKEVNIAALGPSPEMYTQEVKEFLDRMKGRSRDLIINMVDFMPKQELAYTAEAFVTFTSIKRKVSMQEETVGGPIDVAVITKNEGFVWIKRKHYFDRELNPGYHVGNFRGGRDGGTNDGRDGEINDGTRASNRRGRRTSQIPAK